MNRSLLRFAAQAVSTALSTSGSTTSKIPTVVLCLSGGVDSSVAAALAYRCLHSKVDVAALLHDHSGSARKTVPVNKMIDAIREGLPMSQVLCNDGRNHNPSPIAADKLAFRAVFMNNWRSDEHDDDDNDDGMTVDFRSSRPSVRRARVCENAMRDFESASTTLSLLGGFSSREASPLPPLSLSMLDFSEQYHHRCLSPLLAAFASGGSCNVDVLCNSRIKFGCLLDHCRQHFGDDCYLVTGHYARHYRRFDLVRGTYQSLLARPATWSSGVDVLNDQTHFLADVCTIKQLPHALFPLGVLFESKADVRKVAEALGLHHVARKKTSTGLCFVNEHVNSSRKQAAGAFPMWLHAQRKDSEPLEETLTNSSGGMVRATRWMMLHVGPDGLESTRNVTPLVAGLHKDQRDVMLATGSAGSLPAYFVTEGERLHVVMRNNAKDDVQSVKRAYVVKKLVAKFRREAGHPVAHPIVDASDIPTAHLSVILLSASHQTAAMLFNTVTVTEPRWSVAWDERNVEGPTSQLYVSFRHQDAMLPCSVEMGSAASPAFATVRLKVGNHVRCPAAGQLAVFYGSMTKGAQVSTVVVGCAWVL